MSLGAIWRQAIRAWEFARHVPAARLVRRIEREVRQRVRDRVGAAGRGEAFAPASATAAVDRPPLPIMPPRGGLSWDKERRPRLTFLGRSLTMPGPAVDWHVAAPAPSAQLWRMNLNYMEYLESLSDAQVQALMTDWIDANPWSRKGAWRDAWNSYALSIRVVVWMQQLARRPGIEQGARAAIEAGIARQLNFLERNLETDLGGNHLLKNIKALLWGTAHFGGPDAERWRRRGLELLADEGMRQILPDGMHFERSASYHTQAMVDLLECRHALGSAALGQRLDEALGRMAQVTADLGHPDGRSVLFNDSGLGMAYAPAEALAAVEQVLGLKTASRAVFAMPDAGYFGLRTADSYVVADCGPIAPDDLPAHGHGDVLSFEWSLGGNRIIVDQGVHEYVAGPKRTAARAASSHNTLSLDGVDQADFFGAFRCGRRPTVEVRRYEPRADGFLLEGAHDGYRHLPGRPVHARRFDVGPRRIVICDRIEGTTDRRASIAFLLAPAVTAAATGREALLSCGAATIRMSCSAPIAVEEAVWWPDMGVEHATRRLRITLPAGSAEAVTVFEAAGSGGVGAKEQA